MDSNKLPPIGNIDDRRGKESVANKTSFGNSFKSDFINRKAGGVASSDYEYREPPKTSQERITHGHEDILATGKKGDKLPSNMNEARFKIIKARIRNGVIQRRKKVATQPGYTMRGGQVTRMTAAERRRRKLGAKRAKIKRRSKKSQMLRKRKMSLRKRSRLGL